MIREAISDLTEDVATFEFGLEELVVLTGGAGEMAINPAALEAEVKNPEARRKPLKPGAWTTVNP